MGNVFVNEQNFWEQTKFFMNDGVVQNKNYEGRTIWIVQRNKELSFYKKRKKKLTILNQRFFLKKTFEQYNIKKTIFNEQFYKTIVLQWENEEIDGKWKITLRKSEIKFLLNDKKKTYKMNYEWTIWKKSKAPISRKTLAPMAAMSWPNNTFRQIN